jgi:hypothetical protein
MAETQQFSDLMDEYITGMVLLKRGEGQIDPDKLAFVTLQRGFPFAEIACGPNAW